MSGSYFGYDQYKVDQIADQIEHLILDNDNNEKNEWGDTIGNHYGVDTIHEFKRGLMYLRLAAIYVKRIDWLVSGDDREETFHKQLLDDISEIKI